jgi:O-antigen ligase
MQKGFNTDIAFILSLACFLSCGAQMLEIFLQSRGSTLFGVDDYSLDFINSGRMVGLFNHPGSAGKYVFLLLCFALPLTTRSEIPTRRLAHATIICGLIVTLYTQSRANTLAVGVTLVLWIVFSGRNISLLNKIGAFSLSGLILVMNSDQVSAIQARQEVDPLGGYREWFLKTAIDQIKKAPLSGTGPNYYIEKVGEYDTFAFAGFPVHNVFVFAIVELGLLLALLFFIPVLAVIFGAIGKITYQTSFNPQTATVYALIPGFLAISLTGWGLISSAFLPLWFLGFGFISSDKLSHEERTSRKISNSGSNFRSKSSISFLVTDNSNSPHDSK